MPAPATVAVLAEKFADEGPQEGEGEGGGHAQEAAGGSVHAGQGVFRLLEFGQGAEAVVVEDAALVGEVEGAGGSLEQPRAQVLLELGDLSADAGALHAEGTGGAGEAPRAHDLDEDCDRTKLYLVLRNDCCRI